LRAPVGAALALCLWAGAAAAQAVAADPNQEIFLAGVRAMAQGDYGRAIGVLGALADRTGEPRVRLEFARALYLNGDYRQARSEFLKVYRLRNLPYRVRRTINVFLADIDQRIGYFEPSVGVELNSNPGQIAASGTYQVLGVPLQFERGRDARAAGLALQAAGAAPLSERLSLVGSAGATLYSAPGVSFAQASAALRRSTRDRLGWTAIGANLYSRDRNQTVVGLYLEGARRFPMADDRELSIHGSVTRLEVTPDRALSGLAVQGDVGYALDLGRDTALKLGVGASYASARYKADRRWNGAAAAQVIRAFPRLNKVLTLSLAGSVTEFGAVDPFFGVRRRDLQSTVEVRILNGTPIHGLFPGVSVTYDRRDSSIPFYSYSRQFFAFDLRRRF
jgi:hypothetical protein